MSGTVRTMARRGAASVAAAFGAVRLGRRRNRERLLIVNYHGLGRPEQTRHWLLLPMAAFERQLILLKRAYDVLPLDVALEQLRQGTLARPTAVVTFDDGYRNNLELGLPVLERLDVPATVFLATGFIGTRSHLWATRVDFAVRQSSAREIAWAEGRERAVLPTPGKARDAIATRVKNWLKTLPPERRKSILPTLLEAVGVSEPAVPPEFDFLNWEEVERLERSGLVSLGAHTVDHEILSHLSDDELHRQVEASAAEVRRRCRRPSRAFAYPNGRRIDFDHRTRDALPRAALDAGLTTIGGLNGREDDAFALRRLVVDPSMSLAEFEVRAAGLLRDE
jgi:peptidoglycan/xylan/chitin deacetylase (PgdA/CDA1 family)